MRALRILAKLFRSMSIAMFLFLAFYIVSFLMCQLENPMDYQVTRIFVNAREVLDAVLLPPIRENIPVQYKGKDFSMGILIVALIIPIRLLSIWAERFEDRAYLLETRRNLEKIRKDAEGQFSDAELAKLDSALSLVRTGEETDRSKLLQIYAETKKLLERHQRFAVFVAIDVVDSTGIKHGEEPEVAERDFLEYKNMVVSILEKHHYYKSAWTPDGAMICFNEVPQALAAAKDVLQQLDHFNKHTKVVKKEFKVRIGVNAGKLGFEDNTPLQEISSRIIDIAGHMQKYANPNSIWINGHVLKEAGVTADFKELERTVDNCQVWEWTFTK